MSIRGTMKYPLAVFFLLAPAFLLNLDQSVHAAIGNWKVLVLIYPETDADYEVSKTGPGAHYDCEQDPVYPCLGESRIEEARQAANDFRDRVFSWSDQLCSIDLDIEVISHPIRRVSRRDDPNKPETEDPISYWVAESDIEDDIRQFMGPPSMGTGNYDSIIVVWDSGPIPTAGYGGLGYSNGFADLRFTYANILFKAGFFNEVVPGEAMVHEWLHGVGQFYRDALGYSVVDSDEADPKPGDPRYFKDYSANDPPDPYFGKFGHFYRDILIGEVILQKLGFRQYVGITPAVWGSGSVRASTHLRPLPCQLLSPVEGTCTETTTPTLHWAPVSEDFFRVTVHEGDPARPVIAVETAGFSWTIPPGSLSENRSYTWTVESRQAGVYSIRNDSRVFTPTPGGRVSEPAFDPDGGGYPGAVWVRVSCDTPGAEIHYTLDGLEPTVDDPAVDSGSFVAVLPPGTLRARAFKSLETLSCFPSPVKSAEYRVARGGPLLVAAPEDVTVSATEENGARGEGSPPLAGFLAGGTAKGGGDLAPVRLPPQVNGADVDGQTLFPLGDTAVTFRFRDSSGRTASDTARVKVIRLEDGDIFVGSGVPLSNGGHAGTINLVRGGVIIPYCQSTHDYFHPEFWNPPHEVIVDRQGRVVFLASLNSFFFHHRSFGLFRCAQAGAPPERLAIFLAAGSADPTHPVPFPDDYFSSSSGLHLSRLLTIAIDDDDLNSLPRVVLEDAYVFVADLWEPQTLTHLEAKSLRYRAGTGEWEDGPEPPQNNPGNRADMTYHSGSTYSVRDNTLRRFKEPLRLKVSGKVGGAPFVVSQSLFGGLKEVSHSSQGELILDDLTVPNPSVCEPDGSEISTLVPYAAGGGFNVLSSLSEVVFDSGYGLVATSTSVAAGTPYLAEIDQALLNDDPSDDRSAYFLWPASCLPARSLKFRSLMYFWSPAGDVNGVEQLVSFKSGMFGAQRTTGKVVKVSAGDKVQTVASGLHGPFSIAGWPPAVGIIPGAVIIIRLDSPIQALITDPAGRKIGLDPASGEAVNDFGGAGYDSGPGEPRFYAIEKALSGDYQVQSLGTGHGVFTIHVYSIDLSRALGDHILASGVASPGKIGRHDFHLPPEAPPRFKVPYRRGDANADGLVDISDAVNVLGFLFLNDPREVGCIKTADFNDDAQVDISDPVSILGYLFLGEPKSPVEPFSACGTDPTPDELSCDLHPPCR